MKNRKPRAVTLLGILAIAILSILLAAGCGSAEATAKKKSKKSKPTAESTVEEKKDAESKDPHDSKADDDQHKDSDNKEHSKKVSDKERKAIADSIWSDLTAGNKRFMAGRHTTVKYSSVRQELVKGQKPDVIVLGCADSRVPPEFVFDKNLGELFVIREAGNIADKVSLGSIEYAVEHLHSRALVILGHESCGAVAASVSGEKMPSDNIQAIVSRISPAFNDSKTCLIGGESNLSCVELNVRQSSKDILMKSPIIKEAVEAGKLSIFLAVYRMATGEVVRLD